MRSEVIAIVAILIMMAGIGFVSGSELIFEDDFESYIVGSYPSSPWYSIWLGNTAYMPDLYTVNAIPVDEVVSDPENSMNEGDAAKVSYSYGLPAQVYSVEVEDRVEVHGAYTGYERGEHTTSLEGSGSGLVKSSDTTLLWENETADYVLSVSVSENGEYVAIGSRDTYVYYFNKSGGLIWKHKTNGAVSSVSTSNDGNYVIAGSDDCHIYYFDKDGFLWRIEVDERTTTTDISSDGRYAIAGSWNKYVYFFDSQDSNKLLWKRLLDVCVGDVSISDNGEYIAIGGGCVYLLDKYNTTIWEKDISGGIVDISGDGNYILAGGRYNRHTYCYDRSGKLEWDDPYDEYLDDNHGGSIVRLGSVGISTDGSYSVVGTYGFDLTVRSFDKTGNVVWRIKNDTYAVDIAGDGHYIAAGVSSSEMGERILYIDNFDDGNIIYDYSLEDPVWVMDLSKDGKCFAAAAKNTVYFFGSPGGNPEPNITAQIYSDGWKPVESFSVHPLETRDIKFTIENRGWGSNLGYIDISVSNGLDIVSWEDDSSGYMNYENLGPNSNNPTGEASYSDGSRRVPQFELLSGYKPFGSGEKNTVTVTVKATGEGEQWIKYRASMESSDGYVRDPSSGDVDQQGWHAYNITVTVDGIQPDVVIPIEDEYADWISIGDINDDGLNDIVMENGDIFYQQLDNSFLLGNLGFDGICVCTGKINNDDLNDIVMTSHFSEPPTNYGLIHVYYQQNDNTFNDVPDLTIETGYWAKYCQIDDINNDELNDILVGFGIIGSTGETSTKIFYQKEDGSFSSTPDVDATWLDGIVSLSDFNQDGLKDLVSETASTWGLVVYYQSPDHTFDSTYDERMTHLPFGVDTLFKGMGDVDGNGLDDIIYNNNRYPDQSVVYSQLSDHSFILSDISYVAGRDVNSIDIGDLNDDGQNDVAIFYDDHTSKGPGFIGIYYQKYVMDVEMLSPADDFSVLKGSNVPIKANVTLEGQPITGATLTVSFSNGDPDVTLTAGENGIHTGTWTPTNTIEGQVESPVEITIEAYHGILRRGYAKVDGVIRTEIPLNMDIISPEAGFTVNKTIPQLIRIKVTDGSGNVVPGSTITKSEASFSNGDSAVQLYDDGLHHDGSADDGIYANVWIPENINSENNIDVGIEVNAYSGEQVLVSKEVYGVLTPNEYVLLDTVVAYEDDVSKSSVISIYYNVSKEDPELYNLFLEINRKNEDHIEYLDYTINSFGELSISISEDVDFINNLGRTYALNWSEYKQKVPQQDEWPDGTVVSQYFSYADYYEDATIGIRTPDDIEKMTSDVLSIINSIIPFVPDEITYVFGIVLGMVRYILETAEDTVFDADLIIGEDSLHKEFSQHNIRDMIIQSWLDDDKEYESVVTITPLKFQNPGKNEIVMQLFADLDRRNILYNKKISINILGIDDGHVQPNEQIWGDVVLENGFEVLDNEIMYSSAMGDDPQLCTAISVSRKVSKDDPNKQVLFFEISRKTDPENDHRYYINLRNIIFQMSFDEDTDINYSQIKDYEIGERNFGHSWIYLKDYYELWPDGDQLTDDIKSCIPQYFEYTDIMIYPETHEGRHYNFYHEIPPVSDYNKKMAKSKLLFALVHPCIWPIHLMCTFDAFLEKVWQEKCGVDFIGDQKPSEEIINTNERDLVVRSFLHERPEDDYESIVSEIPIILKNENPSTDVYFTILFSVGGKTAAYSKKVTLDKEFNPTQPDFESKRTMILECPANLHAYDDEGNHVGLNPDGTVDLEIPHSYYKGANSGRETITIFGNSSFLFEVEGYGDGEFNLTLLSQSADDGLVSRDYTKIPLSQNTIAKIITNETINPTYSIQIDRDGDGEVDYPQLPNSTEQIILSSTIYVPIDNQTIQEAINIARENDTIYVLEGVYNESITVDKALFIIGEDKNSTIIDGGGSGKCINVTADNVKISGFTLQNGTTGILLYPSNNTIICGNNISANGDGINLCSSNSDENIITDNYISDNTIGIVCLQSNNNLINNNVLFNNYYGIYLSSQSSSNSIYHNNFVGNTNPACDNTGTNQWNNGYPSGGNYWSGYTGDDYYSGPNQDILGSDGILDAPYDINGDAGAQDNYPFVNKDGWSTKDLTVTVLHPNGGESIPVGTQVQVSAHATDDTAVTSVTFSYSNNSGSNWNSIGAGTRVSGTDKDGLWNRTWNTNGLGAGSNYLIRAVADDGTSTREDQSDSTFSLTPSTTNTIVSIESTTSSTCDTVSITIDTNEAAGIGAAHMALTYDESKVRLNSVSDGALGVVTWNDVSGTVAMVAVTTSCPTGNNIKFADLEFCPVAASGCSALDIEVRELNDCEIQSITPAVNDGEFCISGDTPPSAPTLNDPGTTDTDGSYTVRWSSVNGATNYTLEEGTSGSFGSPTVVYSGSGTSTQITGRSNGTYYYRVKACNACGCSGWSNVEDIEVDIPNGNIITVDDSGGADYTTIQEAVNNAGSGYTIKVRPGTYGHVATNKSLKLIGEYKETTIIDGGGSGQCIYMIADNVEISGFTIQNGIYGVWLESSGACVIENNVISDNYDGIYLKNSNNNTITHNSLSDNIVYFSGIHLSSSNNNAIIDNDLSENRGGISLFTSYNNLICRNNLNNNGNKGIYLSSSSSNTICDNNLSENDDGVYLYNSNSNLIHHNNLIDNIKPAYDDTDTNQWDNGYPSGGNYWSNYMGGDHYSGPNQDIPGSDGIGDTPYYISSGSLVLGYSHVMDYDNAPFHTSNEDIVDRYPLMQPLGSDAPSKGDLNHDNHITPADATIALQLAASGGWDANADMNRDSRITSLDALMILQAAVGTIEL